MSTTKYQHQLPDGRIAKRTSKSGRIYTHVIVRTAKWVSDGTPGTINHTSNYAPCPPYVAAWVGRPDLVNGAIRAATCYGCPLQYVTAEPINGGERA